MPPIPPLSHASLPPHALLPPLSITSSLPHVPFLLFAPHLRPPRVPSQMHPPVAARHHRRPSPSPSPTPIHHHIQRLLPYFFVISTRTLPSVTSSAASTPASVFSSSSPSPFSTSSSGAAAGQSRLLDFLFALAFSSVLLLALSLNAFPFLSLFTYSSTLLSHHHLPHCQPPSPALWSIGSSDDKSKADRGAGGGEKIEEGEGEEEGKVEVKVETTEQMTAWAGR